MTNTFFGDNNSGCVNDETGTYHEYTERQCPLCNHVFCYSCCGRTNVDQGGKHEPDFMDCPKCGHNIYE